MGNDHDPIDKNDKSRRKDKRLVDDEKKLRRRVPLACLNCKRRKVRCDKQKPCTGCVKNNVAHLCIYLEPLWVDPVARRVARELEAEGDDVAHRVEMEEMLRRQQQEIDRLRMALARKNDQDHAMGTASEVLSSASVLGSILGASMGIPMSGSMGALMIQRSAAGLPINEEHSLSCPNSQGRLGHGPAGHGLALQGPVGCPITGSVSGLVSGTISVAGQGLLIHAPADHTLTATSALPLGKNYPVSVLTKLIPSGKMVPEVADDLFYNLAGFLRCRSSVGVTSLYSWLNSIRLDPQLTALWYKITSLQKSYHLYKKGLLSGETRAPVKSDRSCGHTQCPVVACEFNFMVEQISQPGTPLSLSVSVKGEVLEDSEKLYAKRFNDESVDLLAQLQKMWLDICTYGSDKLTYAQLVFLVDFYLGKPEFQLLERSYELELRHLVRFFAADIMDLVHRDNDDMRLDIAVFLLKMSDAEVFAQLWLKGMHLSLLALVVDEALDVLRLRSAINDAITHEFYRVFPLEAMHQGLGFSRSLVLRSTNSLVDLLSRASQTHASLGQNLVLFVTVLLALLNRLMSLYKCEGLAVDVRTQFSTHLQFLLELLHRDGTPIQVWMDPAHIQLLGANVSPGRTTELRLLFCQIWNDLMRIVCTATYGLVPILRHNNRINQLMEEFLLYIGDAEPLDFHYNYLDGLLQDPGNALHKIEADHCANLITSLKNFYLIARASLLLRGGIMGASANTQVTVRDLSNIVANFSTWGGQNRLTLLDMTRYFEIKTILNYLLFLFTILVFLQYEEKGEAETVAKLIPILFSQTSDINKFLQGSILQFSKVPNSSYVLAAIAENLSMFSHLLAGLLIRFVADGDANAGSGAPELLVYSSKLDRPDRIVIPVSTKDNVIAETDQSVNLLQSIVGKEHHQRTNKIWKFYMTFIRNSHKMNPAAYAKIHEKAFGSGRMIDSCPVFACPSKSYRVSSVRLEQQACPVLHPASPIPMVPKTSSRGPSPGACGFSVTGHKRTQMSDSTEPKRQCPFDHEALKASTGQPFQESNMRQSPGIRSDEEEPYGNKIRAASNLLLRASSMSLWNAAPQVQNSLPSPASMDMIDWDTLPHFNFDLGDENMVMQISSDLQGTSSVDSMF